MNYSLLWHTDLCYAKLPLVQQRVLDHLNGSICGPRTIRISCGTLFDASVDAFGETVAEAGCPREETVTVFFDAKKAWDRRSLDFYTDWQKFCLGLVRSSDSSFLQKVQLPMEHLRIPFQLHCFSLCTSTTCPSCLKPSWPCSPMTQQYICLLYTSRCV